jgi:NAD dependent epimerase/dehydratase family enzyme
VNSTAPSPATDAQLAKAIGAALHRPAVLAVPAAALKLALGPEMASDMVLASQRALPSRLTGAGFTFRHTDLDEAVRSVLAGV